MSPTNEKIKPVNIMMSLIAGLLVIIGFFGARFISESSKDSQYLVDYVNNSNGAFTEMKSDIKLIKAYIVQIDEIKAEQRNIKAEIHQINIEITKLKAKHGK